MSAVTASALGAGQAFFPLDEELELLSGALTPSLQEELVHLGAWMPFDKAAKCLLRFRGTQVSRPTAQRLTEAAGAAYVSFQEQEVVRIERELPEPPVQSARLFMSVDGAMVPLVGGEWAEVKTLVIGEVQPPGESKGEKVIRTAQHSYFSRLTDAESFQRLALVETHRCGVETAPAVSFVADGAEWAQKFSDHHRPDAVRILDFPHAGEHIAAVGQVVLGQGSDAAQTWLRKQLHTLKHNGPDAVLTEVAQMVAAKPEASEMTTHQAYLEKRKAQMQYPTFLAAGWPIGDGATESANKLVVEARLKGSGMHWARPHVDPMLALRNIVCNDQWDEAWPQIVRTLRRSDHQHRLERRLRRRTAHQQTLAAPAPPPPILTPPPTPIAPALHPPSPLPASTPTHTTLSSPSHSDTSSCPPQPRQPWHPPPDHPWRHMPVGRARFRRIPPPDPAKS